MTKRVQVISARHSPGESPPAENWWKTPTVIAAVIAGMAAITVAIIGLGAPKPQPPAPVHIEQQTQGPNSPAVGYTGGNVTIPNRVKIPFPPAGNEADRVGAAGVRPRAR
jgi:hypothetical protein